MSDLKTVLRDVGGILIIVGVITLFALVTPLYFKEWYGINPLFITAAVFFGIGIPLYLIFKNADIPNFKSAMVTAALGWLLISIIGTIPFIMIGFDKTNPIFTMDFLSALFESMSGWTGTGLTMIDKENLLPYTLQFWRSLIQWIGGVGVIVLTLSILARPGTGSYILYRSEGREQKTHPSIVSTVRTIWWIFLLYTVIGVFVLWIIGILDPPTGISNEIIPWASLNHAMTGIATGGFSVTDDSIMGFGTINQLAIIILMVIGGVAFAAHYELFKGRIKKFLSDAQFRAMILLIILGVVTLTLINLNDPHFTGNFLLSLKESGFQFVSAITCTGFSSATIASWTESAKLILSFAMVIGGAAGSTAGGIKLFRSILLSKGVGWRIKRSISTPRRVFVHKLGDKPLSKEDAMDLINEAAIISFMWIILISVGVVVIAFIFPKETLGNVIFEVCSAQGNVGLSTGITSMGMSPYAKTMLIFNMWVGRLEIIPIIVLVKSMFGIRRNVL
ncbi:MAG: TrkH family potassium uptake protein [Atribacterota bacterium]